MTVVAYPALVTDHSVLGLQAAFADFPASTVTGAEPVELIRLARVKLLELLHALEKDGQGWPTPSSLVEIKTANGEGAWSLIWVDVTVDDTPMRVTISIGERLLARIDAHAEALTLTRSAFLAMAAKRQLALAGPLGGEGGQRLYDEVVAAGRKVQETLGPDSPVGRTLAELDAMALDGLRRMADGVSSAITSRSKAPLRPPAKAKPTDDGTLDPPSSMTDEA